ncbi:isoamylase early set domain-containing protein [Petrachloros mirabilis]
MKQSTRKKAAGSGSRRRSSTKRTVTFEYFDPSAKVVTLVGDFNKWDKEAKPLKRDAGGLWKAALKLEPGLYEYKFVINGERWEEDPLNLHRTYNEHGTFNSIRKVGDLPVDQAQQG